MKIYKRLDDVQRDENCIITTGTFDGVHRGHQSIIDTLHRAVDNRDQCRTIVTFEPHPQFVVRSPKKGDLKLLTTVDEKIAIFETLNIDRLIILPFDRQFAQLTAREFIENILIRKIGFRKIVIGYDHAFGRHRQGNYEILKQLSEKYQYSIIMLPPFSLEGEIISSTRIRRLLWQGEVERAARYLGRNYCLQGRVIRGEGRGRTLNVPTANIEPLSADKLVPGDGIYAVWAELDRQKFKAVLYIGSKPTFAGRERSIELHIFNLVKNLYGQKIVIQFKAKIRDDYQFEKVEQLIQQIENDKQRTLEILANHQE